MPLELDPETGLLPANPPLHDATVGELREVFVQPYDQLNPRQSIWTSYLGHRRRINQLFSSHTMEQWVDGSFTTEKPNPEDVDFTTFLDVDQVKALSAEEKKAITALFRGPETESSGLLDSYAVMVKTDANGEEVEATRKMRDYWRRWFGRTRDGTPKGIARTMVGGGS